MQSRIAYRELHTGNFKRQGHTPMLITNRAGHGWPFMICCLSAARGQITMVIRIAHDECRLVWLLVIGVLSCLSSMISVRSQSLLLGFIAFVCSTSAHACLIPVGENIFGSQLFRWSPFISDRDDFVSSVPGLLQALLDQGYPRVGLISRLRRRVLTSPILFGVARGNFCAATTP